MKVFIDECVDWRLAREIADHETRTAHQLGWAGIRNGELLALAAVEFDVFLTVDRNLSFQQQLPRFEIAVVVLRARSNRLADLRPRVPKLLESLSKLVPGTVVEVGT